MEKKTIQLNEDQLSKIIKESLINVLKEGSYDQDGNFDKTGHQDELEELFNYALKNVSNSLGRFEETLSYIRNADMEDGYFLKKVSDILNLTRQYSSNIWKYDTNNQQDL